MTLQEMGLRAKEAARVLRTADAGLKNRALQAMADRLRTNTDPILAANAADLEAARQNGMRDALIDRLTLTTDRLVGMANGLLDVAALPDPIGEIIEGYVRPNGMRIQKTRVPLGVIGMIYEARPNVTSDAAGIALKAGNAVILRGGKEALHTNLAVATALRQGLSDVGLPEDAVQLIDKTDRETVREMMRLNEYIDVLIPRGGAGLIRTVVENATVPVIQTGVGNCHVYVDKDADIEMAASVVVNAKASRPSVCNAAETLLVHKAIAESALPVIAKALDKANVRLRCCERSLSLCRDYAACEVADNSDWETEYGDYIMAVKIVDSLDDAIDHIAQYSTHHSEAIITDSHSAAEAFTAAVDSAAVYVNASTRFTDGGEFGMGAEIGISTQKLHARGPMGLRELTSVKYIVFGNGQVR
ncbi:MAG: glutamate-5-semialdehyde dehydrogenase [Clostridia bacterium]|nr:glutamate-5-semialdehyde dehydrogenase [Clostridia bacterium]